MKDNFEKRNDTILYFHIEFHPLHWLTKLAIAIVGEMQGRTEVQIPEPSLKWALMFGTQ